MHFGAVIAIEASCKLASIVTVETIDAAIEHNAIPEVLTSFAVAAEPAIFAIFTIEAILAVTAILAFEAFERFHDLLAKNDI